MKNNIPLAVVGGAAGALLGAFLWAAVTVTTNFQIGFMAIGVGILVGLAVRMLGSGTSPVFGVIGAVFALLGCVLGNFLSALGFLAKATGANYLDVLTGFDYGATVELMKATFSPMDLLFYGIAVWEGYKFSIADGTSRH